MFKNIAVVPIYIGAIKITEETQETQVAIGTDFPTVWDDVHSALNNPNWGPGARTGIIRYYNLLPNGDMIYITEIIVGRKNDGKN